jgi:hypothetical protein
MRVFKTKQFARFLVQEGISEILLCEAVKRAITGLIDADLGGSVIKQRIAREGQGRSSGYRSISYSVEMTVPFLLTGSRRMPGRILASRN